MSCMIENMNPDGATIHARANAVAEIPLSQIYSTIHSDAIQAFVSAQIAVKKAMRTLDFAKPSQYTDFMLYLENKVKTAEDLLCDAF